MMIRRTDDPNICYVAADAVALWCYGIVEFRIDTRNKKFILTPILRDRSEGLPDLPVIDATDMFERFQRERR